LMKWVPCAWPCPSLEPARRTRGLSTPLLDGGDDEDLLSALAEVRIPLTMVQIQQLNYATNSHQVELMTIAAQFVAHYADIVPPGVVRNPEVIDSIIRLINSDYLEVLIAASSAVSVLSGSADENLKEVLVKRGVIKLAVKHLRSESNAVVINALSLLTTFAGAADRYKNTIVRDGALKPLCDLAFNDDTRIQKGAGGAILNLSHVDSQCASLIVCGVCASLHRFLISNDVHLQFYAAATISNLSVQVGDPSDLVNNEGLLCLIKLLGSTDRLIQQSCIALRNLASKSTMQSRLVDCGVLEPLYPLLRHPDTLVQTAALSLLHNLSILDNNEARIINMGYIPELSLVVRQWQLPEGQRHAAATLRNLATPEHIRTLVTSGIVEVLVNVVINAKTLVDVLYEVTAVLAVLARDTDAQDRLVKLASVRTLVQLLAANVRNRVDSRLVFYSLGVIGGSASNSKLREMIVHDTDIVTSLTHYIVPDTSPDLIKVVLWTTDILIAHPNINDGVKSEMLASVTHLQAHSTFDDVRIACEDLLSPS